MWGKRKDGIVMSGKKMFQQESMFTGVMTRIFDIVLLDILCVVFCVPVITGGASVTAMYYVMMKMVRNEEGGIVKSFWKAFRENLRQSVPMTLLFAGAAVALTADFHILGKETLDSAAVMYGGCIALSVFVMAVFSYAFPLLARFENTVRNTLVNAVKIAVTHLPYTAVILAVNCIAPVWFLVSPETFAPVFWIWAFVGIGASGYINSLIFVRIFDEFS